MYERMSLKLARLMALRVEDLKREDGQGATEYALVIGFVVVTLAHGSCGARRRDHGLPRSSR